MTTPNTPATPATRAAGGTIRQVVLGADGGVHLEEAPAPAACGPHDVLLAPLRLGICGSDVHVLRGRHPFVGPPVVTGHEGVARVVAAGHAVTRCAPGDLVVVNPLHTCGSCPRCRSGAANRCDEAKVLGFKLPGLAQDRVVVEDRYCHRVPDGLDAGTAVLTEPLAVGWHAAGRVAHPLGRVLVIGGGPVGLAVLTAVSARGADHVTLMEPVPEKRALALRLGATTALPPSTATDTTAGTTARTSAGSVARPGAGVAVGPVDSVFDCVASPATLAVAAGAVVPGGTIVCVGVPPGDTTLPLARLQRWEIDVRGTGLYLGTDIDAVLAHLADPANAARAAALVTAVYPVERAADAFAATDDPRNIKVTIAWPEPTG